MGNFFLTLFIIFSSSIWADDCVHDFSHFFKAKNEEQIARAVSLLPDFYRSADEFRKLAPSQLQMGNASYVYSLHNSVMNQLKNIFSLLDIELKEVIVPGEREYKALALPLGRPFQNRSIEKIRRFALKAELSLITFDFIETDAKSSRGVYLRGSNQVSLSSSVVHSLFDRGEPGFVIWHELEHALFQRKRDASMSSIYHFRWTRLASNDLPGDPSLYRGYMSAEEIYNFIRGPYWLLKGRFTNLNKENRMEILSTFEAELKRLKIVASKGKKLAEESVKAFDNFDNRLVLEDDAKIILVNGSEFKIEIETTYKKELIPLFKEKKELLSKAKAESRTLTDDEKLKLESLIGHIDSFKEKIAKEQKEKLEKLIKVSSYFEHDLESVAAQFNKLHTFEKRWINVPDTKEAHSLHQKLWDDLKTLTASAVRVAFEESRDFNTSVQIHQ